MRVVRRAVIRVGTRMGMGALLWLVTIAVWRPIRRCVLPPVVRATLGEVTRAVNKTGIRVVTACAMTASMWTVRWAARVTAMRLVTRAVQTSLCAARLLASKDLGLQRQTSVESQRQVRLFDEVWRGLCRCGHGSHRQM